MRACEGCRRRKIKCDAATTNTWPCSACIRLKLHCVRPNGFDGATDSTTYDTSPMPNEQFQQMSMQHQVMNPGAKLSPAAMYGTQPQQVYPDASASYQHVSYDTSQQPGGMHYGAVAPPGSMMDHQYAGQNVFPTPPMQQPPPPPGAQQQPSPEAYSSPGDYQHQDLADLLGTLKVNETGTGMAWRIPSAQTGRLLIFMQLHILEIRHLLDMKSSPLLKMLMISRVLSLQ